jgi:hypothetical protein
VHGGHGPALLLREVEEPCPHEPLSGACTTPHVRPGTYLHRLMVDTPFTEPVYVPRKVMKMRLVLQEVTRQELCKEDVIVPVVTRVPKVRMVFREEKREQPCSRMVWVPYPREEVKVRKVYRTVRKTVPCTHDVYVPVVTWERKVRLVYATERVPVTRTVPVVRLVNSAEHDPATGKLIALQKPLCEQRTVTEMESRICLRPQEVEEKVTSYRLERRTDLREVEDHVLVCENAVEKVTDWRLEKRVALETVTCHVLRPEVVLETVTHYRRECRTELRTVKHYVPLWREEAVTCYQLETRCGIRPVEKVLTNPGDIVVPVTKIFPVSEAPGRRHWVAEPLGPVHSASHSLPTTSGDGFTATWGARSAVGQKFAPVP